jgi:hypothetical protein
MVQLRHQLDEQIAKIMCTEGYLRSSSVTKRKENE